MTTKPVGSVATIINPTTVNPTFIPDLSGQYSIKLVITDSKSVSSESSVIITASVVNAAPVANAGAAQSVVTGAVVTLDGSASSDANGDLLTYSWSFTSKPAGSSAALSSSTTTKPTFTADVVGSYVLNLVVNDGKVNSAAVTVTITASFPIFSPKPNAEAEIMTLEATGALMAQLDVYNRVVRELANIRSAYPEVSNIVASPSWNPQELIVVFDSTGISEIQSGIYDDWNSLNAFYGVTQVDTRPYFVLLNFKGRLNIPQLAIEYSKLAHAIYAVPNGRVGDGDDVCLQIIGDTHYFIFDLGGGDCSSGCNIHTYWEFSADSSGNIQFLGSPPQVPQDLSTCQRWL
jgi:hypothetical protein